MLAGAAAIAGVAAAAGSRGWAASRPIRSSSIDTGAADLALAVALPLLAALPVIAAGAAAGAREPHRRDPVEERGGSTCLSPRSFSMASSYRYPGADAPRSRSGSTSRSSRGELVAPRRPLGLREDARCCAPACGLVPHFHGGEVSGAGRGRGPRHARARARPSSRRGRLRLPGARDPGRLDDRPRRAGAAARAARRARRDRAPRRRGGGAGARRSSRCSSEPPTRSPAGSCSGSRSPRRSSPRPRLVLLDEPTSQLDPVAGDELISLLRRLNEEWGTAVVLGEHRLERCLAAADRVIALDGGRLVYDGAPHGFLGGARADAGPGDARGPPVRARRAAAAAGRRQGGPATLAGARRAGRRRRRCRRPRLGDSGVADARRPALAVRDLRVDLDAGDGSGRVLRGLDLEIRAGETGGADGPKRRRQEHAAARLRRPGRAGVGVASTRPRGARCSARRPDDYLVRERVGEELPGEAGAAALAAAGLDWALADADPRDLSGGERQRLALAIAMAGRGAGADRPAWSASTSRRAAWTARARTISRPGSASWPSAARRCSSPPTTSSSPPRSPTRVVLLARGAVIADGAAERDARRRLVLRHRDRADHRRRARSPPRRAPRCSSRPARGGACELAGEPRWLILALVIVGGFAWYERPRPSAPHRGRGRRSRRARRWPGASCSRRSRTSSQRPTSRCSPATRSAAAPASPSARSPAWSPTSGSGRGRGRPWQMAGWGMVGLIGAWLSRSRRQAPRAMGAGRRRRPLRARLRRPAGPLGDGHLRRRAVAGQVSGAVRPWNTLQYRSCGGERRADARRGARDGEDARAATESRFESRLA